MPVEGIGATSGSVPRAMRPAQQARSRGFLRTAVGTGIQSRAPEVQGAATLSRIGSRFPLPSSGSRC